LTDGQDERLVVAFLHVEVLKRSLFVDSRGEELLVTLSKRFQARSALDGSALCTIFQTEDSQTALSALSPEVVDAVLPVTVDEADSFGSGSVHVISAAELLDDILDDEGHASDGDSGASGAKEDVRFQWQLNQMLGHDRVLHLRQRHGESNTSFAVVLWESLRFICQRPYLAVDTGSKLHPIVEALLHASLLEPRWGPTRLVLSGPQEGACARRQLLAWIDAQWAKLSWPQRLEYGVQLLREREEITRRVESFGS